MNYHYFDNGTEQPRGFVRVACIIRPGGYGYGYSTEIIGEHTREDTDWQKPGALSRKIKDTPEEADIEIWEWAKRNNYRLEKLD